MAENLVNPGEGDEICSEESCGEEEDDEEEDDLQDEEEDVLKVDDDLFGAPYATKTVENNITVEALKDFATQLITTTVQCMKLQSLSRKPLKDLLFGKKVTFSEIKGECIQKNTCYFNFSLCTISNVYRDGDGQENGFRSAAARTLF